MYLQAIDGFGVAGTERTKGLFTLFVRPFNFSQGLWESECAWLPVLQLYRLVPLSVLKIKQKVTENLEVEFWNLFKI